MFGIFKKRKDRAERERMMFEMYKSFVYKRDWVGTRNNNFDLCEMSRRAVDDFKKFLEDDRRKGGVR